MSYSRKTIFRERVEQMEGRSCLSFNELSICQSIVSAIMMRLENNPRWGIKQLQDMFTPLKI